MKTLFLLFVTLLFSQWLYLEFGPSNPLAVATTVLADSFRWLLDALLGVVS